MKKFIVSLRMFRALFSHSSLGTLAGLLLCLLSVQSVSGAKDPLREGFMNPPDSSRPGVYWYFMDGNISREAITGDLESMKAAGIVYVLLHGGRFG